MRGNLLRNGIAFFGCLLLVIDLASADVIHDAVERKDAKKVMELVNALPETANAKKSNGVTPLHIAASNGSKEIAIFLLSKNAEIDATTKDDFAQGFTPLCNAVSANQVDLAYLLLNKGANPNAKYSDRLRSFGNRTPLHAAALNLNRPLVQRLIEKGADVGAQQKDGQTPLHVGLREKRHDTKETDVQAIVVALVNGKAEVNVHDDDTITPLHWAAFHGYANVCNYLVQQKADVNAKNEEGQTPLAVAAKRGHTKVVLLLKNAGGTQ
ncbi:MAG TPA: ankyrin repeat domain-containing protein [Tepidisphaeraceae bacterium]|jgi:ankyrin repeat protein